MSGRKPLLGFWFVAATAVSLPAQDSNFSDEDTRTLVERAVDHRAASVSVIAGYSASVHSRMEGRGGGGWFGGVPLFVYEAVSHLEWTAPNYVYMAVRGTRLVNAPIPGFRRRAWNGFWTRVFTEAPPVVPWSLGDSIQMVGLPDRAALHPLAPGANEHYRYELRDSISIQTRSRSIQVLGISVTPRQLGPSYVSGMMWLDRTSLDVVRLSVAFVGTELFDPTDDDDDFEPVGESVMAELEYSLYEDRVWLPYRQTLSVEWRSEIPGLTKLWATYVNTFDDVDIEAAPTAPVADFVSESDRRDWYGCDGVMMFGTEDEERRRCEARAFTSAGEESGLVYNIDVPDLDSLERFEFANELQLYASPEEQGRTEETLNALAGYAAALPNGWTGREPELPGFNLASVGRWVRFNRVRGLAPGGRVVVPLPGSFQWLRGGARIGLGNEVLEAEVAWLRDSPASLVELSAERVVADVEPWTDGSGFSNSLSAAVLGYDDADYVLSNRGKVALRGRSGTFRGVGLTVQVERIRSLSTTSGSVANDILFGNGSFQPNPAVLEGDFVSAALTRSYSRRQLSATIGTEVTRELAQGGALGARLFGHASIPVFVGDVDLVVSPLAGVALGDSLSRTDFRLGGPATVPGFTYGSERKRSIWSMQVDATLGHSEWVTPTLKGGVAGAWESPDPLVGFGAGVALFRNWLKIGLERGVGSQGRWRFDVRMSVPVR